jgi:hypothetical protein
MMPRANSIPIPIHAADGSGTIGVVVEPDSVSFSDAVKPE